MTAALLICVLALLGGGAGFSTSEPGGTTCGAPPAANFGSGAIGMPMADGTYRMTSGYGIRWGTLHAGVDFAAPVGTPIYAAADGTVYAAGAASGFGLWIVLNHTLPDGSLYSTVYGHMNTLDPPGDAEPLEAGEVVSAGQLIAGVGNNGQSTGPHLHFEVWPGGRRGGQPVDPMTWLAANSRPGDPAPTPSPEPEPAPTDERLNGPVLPEGRQATMPLNAEQQANAETIVGVVKGQGLPLRVAVIAVATAMQESRLTVIDYGDLAGPDSRGLFQQRAPWGPYAERMDPVISTQLFLNGGRGGQRGLLSHDWQGQSLERVVVQTQISVGGYAKWEANAMQIVAAAAGVDPITNGAGPAPTPCTV